MDPIGSTARGMARFRPNHSQMISHVMKVRKAWEKLASDSARLVRLVFYLETLETCVNA